MPAVLLVRFRRLAAGGHATPHSCCPHALHVTTMAAEAWSQQWQQKPDETPVYGVHGVHKARGLLSTPGRSPGPDVDEGAYAAHAQARTHGDEATLLVVTMLLDGQPDPLKGQPDPLRTLLAEVLSCALQGRDHVRRLLTCPRREVPMKPLQAQHQHGTTEEERCVLESLA